MAKTSPSLRAAGLVWIESKNYGPKGCVLRVLTSGPHKLYQAAPTAHYAHRRKNWYYSGPMGQTWVHTKARGVGLLNSAAFYSLPEALRAVAEASHGRRSTGGGKKRHGGGRYYDGYMIDDRTELVKTVDGTWMILVGGFQWGPPGSERDASGAAGDTWSSAAKAVAAFRESEERSYAAFGGRSAKQEDEEYERRRYRSLHQPGYLQLLAEIRGRAGGKKRHGSERRMQRRKSDPIRCRYRDCPEHHPVALDDDATITCPTCREYMGFEPLSDSVKKLLKTK